MSHLGCWPSTIKFDWDFFFLFFLNNFSNIESTANSSLSVHIWKIQKLGLFLAPRFCRWSLTYGVFTPRVLEVAWWEGVLVGQAQVPGLGVDLRGRGPTCL